MKILKPCILLGAWIWTLLPELLYAAETQPVAETMAETMEDAGGVGTASQFGPPSVDFTWLFLKTILAMVVVIALAVIVLRYVLPRLSMGRTIKGETDIHVSERFPLDSKKMLYVVNVEGKRLLIAASEQYVGLITELDREENK